MAQGLVVSRLPQISQIASRRRRVLHGARKRLQQRFAFLQQLAAPRAAPNAGPAPAISPGSCIKLFDFRTEVRHELDDSVLLCFMSSSGAAGATTLFDGAIMHARRSRHRGSGRARRAPSAPAPRLRSWPPCAFAFSARPGVGAPPSRASVTTQRTPVQSLSFCARSPASVLRRARTGAEFDLAGLQPHEMDVVLRDCTFRTGSAPLCGQRHDVFQRAQCRRILGHRLRRGRGAGRHRAARRKRSHAVRSGDGADGAEASRPLIAAISSPADRAPACRSAADRRHRPDGSAPSRLPRSAASHRALRSGP